MKKNLYACEKLSAARRLLMLPHPEGEARSIFHAFVECSMGLKDINVDDLDDSARGWVTKIRDLMNTSGIGDSEGRGTFLIRAEQLTEAQKFELSRTVDELANWFNREFWSA